MSREKQGYRDTMAALNEMFPGQGALGKREAARFLGISVKTLTRRGIKFSEATGRVTFSDFARQISI